MIPCTNRYPDNPKIIRLSPIRIFRTSIILPAKVVIIGVGTRIEIWNKDKWEEYNSEENISADDIAENMTMLGI